MDERVLMDRPECMLAFNSDYLFASETDDGHTDFNSETDDGQVGLEKFPWNSMEGAAQQRSEVWAAAPAPVAAGQDTAIQPWMSRESMMDDGKTGFNSETDDEQMGGLKMFGFNSMERVGRSDVWAPAPAPGADGQDTAIQPWMSQESLMDVILIDDQSYTAGDLQRWIFNQLDTYSLGSGSSISSANVAGSPGGLEVSPRNLSYNENKQRKLFSSNESELLSKAYIVDLMASKPLVSSCDEPGPSTVNIPGVKENIQLCPCPPGDANSRLAYIGAGWKKNATRKAPPCGTERSGGKKAKTTTQQAPGAAAASQLHQASIFAESQDGAEEDALASSRSADQTVLPADDCKDADLNPDKIKVWGFYRVTGEVLRKIERLCKQPNRRALAKDKENTLTIRDLGPVLYIVLPSSHEPVKLKNVLRKLVSSEAVDKMARMMKDRFGANIPEHARQELLHSLHDILLGVDLEREEDSSEGQEGGGTQRRLIAYCCNPCEIPGTVYAASVSLTSDADDDLDKAAREISEIAENPAAVVGKKVISPRRSIDIGAASVCEVTSDYGSRNALIWAVSKYDGAPELPNAIEDGSRLRSMLLRVGWNVTFLTDVIKAKAQESLREFRDLVKNNSDACLFAFVGHGLELGGKNYLVPRDAKFPHCSSRASDFKTDLKVSVSEADLGIPLDEVKQMLAESQAGKKKPAHTIVVLDCCRSDACTFGNTTAGLPDAERERRGGREATSLQSEVRNSLIVYSTTAGHTAADGRPGEGGPFMRAFTKHAEIAGNEINSVLKHTRRELQRSTSAQLAPCISLLQDDFYFSPPENYVKPSLQVLAQFVFKHLQHLQHQDLPSVDGGDVRTEEMYAELQSSVQQIFIEFLREHAAYIAELQSTVQLVERRDAHFLEHPAAAEERSEHQAIAEQREQALYEHIQRVEVLRAHQIEAVSKCLTSNCIINLPTGTGKTLVAVKVIDYFLQRHPGKNVVFVVPTRALVQQQARYIRRRSDVPTRALVQQQARYIKRHSDVQGCTVAELCGMEMDAWDLRKWQECKRSNKVLLGTPEVFRSSLVDSRHLHVTDMSLCVFDECHHANGNSSMACMLRDALNSRQVPLEERPRIVGLTASFCSGKCDKLIAKRHDIEALLNAQMWALSEEQEKQLALADRVFRSVGGWLRPINREALEMWAAEVVKRQLAPLTAALAPIKSTDKVARHAAHVLIELGMAALIFYLEKGLLPELQAIADRRLSLCGVGGGMSVAAVEKIKRDCKDVQREVAAHVANSARELARESALAANDIAASIAALEPHTQKAARLLLLLRDINAQGPKKGIVFVKQTALLYPLAHICRQDNHRVAEVGGTTTMAPTLVNKALDDFRRGDMMLLIATDAAEEGIDVADCSFVIRFNRFGTTKSHIQGSGRGRARDAEFYYFENDGEDEEAKAARLNDVARDPALALSDAARAADSSAVSGALTAIQVYPFEPPGEAVVNLSNAGKILREYCAAVMRQAISFRDLCRFKTGQESALTVSARRDLKSVCYFTPEGVQVVVKNESDATSHALFLASTTEAMHPRYANANSKKKDAMCFFYVAVVRLRRDGLLDARNKPTARALTYTHDVCAEYVKELQRESVLTLKPKFKGVYQGDSGGVRQVEACDGGGDRGDGDSKGAEEEEKEEEEADLSFLSPEEHTEDDDSEEIILFRPRQSLTTPPSVRTSAGIDSNGNGGSPDCRHLKSLPAAAAAAAAAAAVAATLVTRDDGASKAVGDIDLAANASRSNSEGQQAHVHQAAATRPSIPTSTSLSGGPSHDMTGELTVSASSPPNRSPAACSVSNAPQEFKTLVDRQMWTMHYEEEKMTEQEFRARVVLIKSGGEIEELAWSQAWGSKQKAKHAAAEIGLARFQAPSSPPNSSPAAASATNAPTELQILVDRREELPWSPASGSKQKAKHAAAEIGLARFQAPSSPPNSSLVAASATNAPTELQILVDRRRWKIQYEYEKLGEQEFRARIVVLIKSEGVEEELSWSQ